MNWREPTFINLVFGEFVTFENALAYFIGTFGIYGIAVESIKKMVESNCG